MSKRKVRNVIMNGGQIVREYEYIPGLVWLSCLSIVAIPPILILLMAGKLRAWRPFELLDAEEYDLDKKLNEKAEEMKKIIHERKQVSEYLKAEKAEINKAIKNVRGIGEPYIDDVKKIQDCDRVKPPQKWRELVDKKWHKEKGQRVPMDKRGSAMDFPIDGAKIGHTVGYVDPEHGQYMSNLKRTQGVDDIDLTPKDDQNQGKKGKPDNPKNRRKGESDEEFKARIAAMKRNGNW